MTKMYSDKFFKDRKILSAIIDQANIKQKHFELYNKMFDLTFHHLNKHNTILYHNDIRYFDTFDHAMNHCGVYDYVIIHSVGNLLWDNEFYEHLDNYIINKPDFYFIGFTLDWQGNDWVELHHQMIVINVKKWIECGRPYFGSWETNQEDLPNYTRSLENFHDHYTPYWIEGIEGTTFGTRTKQGHNLIKNALHNKIRIDNFSQQMRDCRLFLYPEAFTDDFYQCIIQTKDYKTTKLNPNQTKWFKLNELPPVIWVYNSEYYNFKHDNINTDNVNKYVGTASGFKYLDILNNNTDVEFIFFDYNSISLEWIKNVKENWDGNDFPSFLENPINNQFKPYYKFINKNIETNQKMLINDFGSELKFKQQFEKFKNSEVKYYNLNLFVDNDIQTLYDLVNENTFVNYSNIFSTDLLLRYYSKQQIENSYNRFITSMLNKIPKSKLYGSNPEGIWNEINEIN
jgi:hypothetical protein